MLKTFVGIMMLLFTIGFQAADEKTDKKEIKASVTLFAKHADEQDVAAMDALLDDQFRTLINRLFGSNTLSFLGKPTYLQLLEDKKIGGDERKVIIHAIDITGNNASVKATFEGKKQSFTSYLLLAKTEAGAWKIATDMPSIQ